MSTWVDLARIMKINKNSHIDFLPTASTHVFFCKKSTSSVTLHTTCSAPDPSNRKGRTSMSWLMDKVAHLRWRSEKPTHRGGTSVLRSMAKMKCMPGPVQMSTYLSSCRKSPWLTIALLVSESSSLGHFVALNRCLQNFCVSNDNVNKYKFSEFTHLCHFLVHSKMIWC